MRSLAKKLIFEEFRTGEPDSPGRAAFRVCEKLGASLGTFAGLMGSRALMSRALALATANVEWLKNVSVKPDGLFEFAPPADTELDTVNAAKGGAELVSQLLLLLNTFIGDALTRRLVSDVWPKAAHQ